MMSEILKVHEAATDKKLLMTFDTPRSRKLQPYMGKQQQQTIQSGDAFWKPFARDNGNQKKKKNMDVATKFNWNYSGISSRDEEQKQTLLYLMSTGPALFQNRKSIFDNFVVLIDQGDCFLKQDFYFRVLILRNLPFCFCSSNAKTLFFFKHLVFDFDIHCKSCRDFYKNKKTKKKS